MANPIDFNALMSQLANSGNVGGASNSMGLNGPSVGMPDYSLKPINVNLGPQSFTPTNNLDGTPINAPSSSSATGGGGHWYDGLVNGAENIYNHLHGLLQGATAGYAGYSPAVWEKNQRMSADTPLQALKREYDMSGLGSIFSGAIPGAFNGLMNPQQAQQNYQQNVNQPFNNMPAPMRLANQFTLGMANDPLSYLPVGAIAKATGLTGLAKMGWDAVKGGLRTSADAAPGLADMLANAPKVNPDELFAPGQEATSAAQSATKPPMGYSDEINNWAFGENPNGVPELTPVATPKANPTDTLRPLDAQQVLNKVMEDIKPEVYQRSTPPAENPKLLHDWLKNELGHAGMPISDTELNMLSYNEKVDLANSLKNQSLARNAYEVAAERGYDLNKLFTGDVPTIQEIGNKLKLGRAAGVYDTPVINLPRRTPVPTPAPEPYVPNFTIAGEGDIPASRALVPTSPAAEEAAATISPEAANMANAAMKSPYASGILTSNAADALASRLKQIMPNGVPVLNKVANGVENTLGKMFVKYHGATPALVDSLQQHEGANALADQQMAQQLAQMQKAHGLTDDEMKAIPYILENTLTPNSDKIKNAADDFKQFFQQQAEKEQAAGFNGNQTLDDMIQNYFPHIYQNSKPEIDAALQRAGYNGIPVSSAFNKERQFETLNQAQAAGLKPMVNNPYLAAGIRASKGNRAVANANLLNELQQKGLIVPQSIINNVRKGVLTGTQDLASSGLPNMVESAIPELKGYYLRPEDEAALQQYFGMKQPGVLANNPITKVLDNLQHGYKQSMYLNPLPHMKNVLHNALLNAGVDPIQTAKYYMDLMKNGGQYTDLLNDAIKNGAVSADTGSFQKQLEAMLGDAKQGGVQSLNPVTALNNSKLGQALHGSLWNMDRASRMAIYKQGLDAGMAPIDAAKQAQKYMVNYNNLTPFEEQVMQRLMPFYRFTKGQMPLQISQWINNTPKMAIAKQFENYLSQAMSGQPLQDGDTRMTTGVNPNGSKNLLDPVLGMDEPLKVLRDGPLAYAYGRMNPFLKEGLDQLANEKYYPFPSVAPNGSEGMFDPTKQAIRDGNGNAFAQSLAHALNNLVEPANGTIANMGSQAGIPNLIDEMLGVAQKAKTANPDQQSAIAQQMIRMFGMSPKTTPSTAMQQWIDNNNAKQAVKAQIDQILKSGQKPPSSLVKQEYAKNPYPGN